jgi:hypothetical protein
VLKASPAEIATGATELMERRGRRGNAPNSGLYRVTMGADDAGNLLTSRARRSATIGP